MTQAEGARTLYKDYWKDQARARAQRAYYERLYRHVRHRIAVEPGLRVLDVAGGNGQLMEYFGIPRADVLDISESGRAAAADAGFTPIEADVQARFPVDAGSYDRAFLFEVLEHLRRPSITLVETHRALKPGGLLYVGQPNMRADGVHHVRRYYPDELLADLDKAGFKVRWTDHIPAYSMRDSILSDIRKNPSWIRKAVQCVNLTLSFLPHSVRYQMARRWPARFTLIFLVCAEKAA